MRAILGLINSIVIARLVNIEALSTYYTSVAAFSILAALLELGIPQLLLYASDHDRLKITPVALGYNILTSTTLSLIALALLLYQSQYNSTNDTSAIIAIALLSAAISMPTNLMRVLEEKRLSMKRLAIIDACSLSLLLIIVPMIYAAIDLLELKSYHIIALITLCPVVAALSLLCVNARQQKEDIAIDIKTIAQIYRESKYFTFNGLLFLTFQQCDLFIAQRALNSSDAGFYAVARNLVNQVGNVVYIGIAKYTNSRIAGQQITTGISDKQRRRYNTNYLMGAIAFVVVACTLSPLCIGMAYGDAWQPSVAIVQILLIGAAARIFSIPSAAQVIAKYGIRIIMMSNIFGIAMIAISGSLGASLGGKEGLAAATVITIVMVAVSQFVKAR